MIVVVVILAGAAVGLGLYLLWRAVRPGPAPLSRAFADREAAGQSVNQLGRVRVSGFRAAVTATIAVLVLFSPLLLVGLGLFLGPYQEEEGAGPVSHRVHEVSFGILFALALVGALTQRRRPAENIAGMQQLVVVLALFSLVMWAALGVFEWGSLLYLVPVGAAAVLHPSRGRLLWPRFRPFALGLALTLMAIGPLVDAAGRELSRAAAQAQDHFTHWGAMAAFFLVILALSLIAALRAPGHRVVAVSAGGAMIAYAIVSLAYPFDASSHPSFWAGISILWGAAWIATGIWYPAHRRREPRGGWLRQILVAAAVVGSVFVLFPLTFLWSDGDSPPNVPHALEVPFEEATPATCLACHRTGEAGAPDVPHQVPNEGISDCLACHRFDPTLAGSAEQSPRRSLLVLPRPSLLLSAEQLLSLEASG